jgi:hypothetical protein
LCCISIVFLTRVGEDKITHILRPLEELQDEFRLTGNENQETRSAKQKKFDKLSIDDKKCKNYLIQRIVLMMCGKFCRQYVRGKELLTKAIATDEI